MPVYFIRSGEDGPVKIGFARDPLKRLATLQTAHHAPLKIIRLIRGDKTTERNYHIRYVRLALLGEWFEFDAEMLTVGDPLPIPERKARVDFDRLILECAKERGVSASALKQWRQRGVPAKYQCFVTALAERRGLPVPAFHLQDIKPANFFAERRAA
jgi:hypothetical protein